MCVCEWMNSAPLSYNKKSDCMCSWTLCVCLCTCVCVCLIYIDAIPPCLYHTCVHIPEKKRAYSIPVSVMRLIKSIIHSKSAIPRRVYTLHITSCLPSDTQSMWCVQSARQAGRQWFRPKWFGLVGSCGADNGHTVWVKCLWCPWLCQQLRLADPKWWRAARALLVTVMV